MMCSPSEFIRVHPGFKPGADIDALITFPHTIVDASTLGPSMDHGTLLLLTA
jgi:hypothetical protein